MIKFEHTEVMGWEAAIRGMRNPMNSWARSDSGVCQDFKCGKWGENDKRPICPFSDPYRDGNCGCFSDFIIGPNDHDLMMRLVNGGPNKNVIMRVTKKYSGVGGANCLSAYGIEPNTVYNQRKAFRNDNWTCGSASCFKIIRGTM